MLSLLKLSRLPNRQSGRPFRPCLKGLTIMLLYVYEMDDSIEVTSDKLSPSPFSEQYSVYENDLQCMGHV